MRQKSLFPVFVRTAWLVIALALASCSAPELEPLSSDAKILAFGDSLTRGYGAALEESYPTVLSELTGLEVINAGVSGETTATGLPRFKKELERVKPTLVILAEGGNDILRNQRHSKIKSNLAAMIEFAHSEGVLVVLLGVPKKNLFSNAAALYDELAQEYDVVYDSSLIADLLRSPSYKSDPIHLNAQGYRAMAEDIHELLSTHWAI